jgi:hypothetical protein
MSNFNYSLDKTSYSWQNAFLWGNFVGHCKKANEGSLGNRTIHVLIAIIEFLPIISQISSICEKLILENFSSTVSPSKTQSLTDQQISIETSQEKHTGILIDNAKEFPENYKQHLLASLSKIIENQKNCKTYKRDKLAPLQEQNRNLPIPLSSAPKPVKSFSKSAIFYSYNAESIQDYGWGCAWRAIQTCLSAYKINPSFEELFHLFGPFENLKHIYEDKYPTEKLSNSKSFAPYDLSSGWAEPFIGHMVMYFYDIPSTLEILNGIPGSCNAPQHVFHNEALIFNSFKERLENHFKTDAAAPIMIDDGTYTLNIVGVKTEGSNTILWIADPHINEGVNKLIDKEKSPAGLYKVTLNETGKQISHSLANEDNHQVSKMFNERSYQGLHFDSKCWMILFPLENNRIA